VTPIPADSPDPFQNRLLYVIVGCGLPPWIFGRQREGVVASLDGMERRERGEYGQELGELSRCAKRVSATLHEQHRALYRREVCISTDARLPRRVQWVPEQHDCIDRQTCIGGGNLRSNPSTHRLSANSKKRPGALEFIPHAGDHRTIAGFEGGGAIRTSALLFCVQEVESDDVEAGSTEGFREGDHEGASLTGAGAVGENQRGFRPP
jgi:hypothetical protein